MKITKVKNKKKIELLVVAILLIFHDTLAFSLFQYEKIIKFSLLAIFVSIFVYQLFTRNIKIQKSSLLIFFVFISLILFSSLYNQDMTLGYFYIIMLLTMGFFTSQMMTYQDFVIASINCMFFLALYSLFIYLLRPIIFLHRELFPQFVNSAGVPMLHFGATVLVDYTWYYRIFGLFRESGVYQIFLNIALYFELFVRNEKVRIVYIIVFVLTILLTFSPPGYSGVFALLIAFIFFQNKRKINKKKIIFNLIFSFFLLWVFVQVFVPEQFGNFISALSKFVNKESSYLGRTTSILVELRLWSERPVFGYGITKGFHLSQNIGSNLLGYFMYNTSTFTGMLVTLGGIFTLLFGISFINVFLRMKNIKILGKLLIISVLILLLSSQLMMYNAYFYTLIFYGFLREKPVLV